MNFFKELLRDMVLLIGDMVSLVALHNMEGVCYQIGTELELFLDKFEAIETPPETAVSWLCWDEGLCMSLDDMFNDSEGYTLSLLQKHSLI